MQVGRWAEPMVREKWNKIVPADIDIVGRELGGRLARPPEGFYAECGCLDIFVVRYTLVLPSIEEVLALV